MLYSVCTCFSKLRLPLKQHIRLFTNVTKPSNSSFLWRRSHGFTTRRSLFAFLKRPKNEELKIKDNVPEQYKLIYRNTMDRYIWFTQMITSTSAAIIVLFTVIKTDIIKYEDVLQTPQISGEMYIYMASFVTALVLLQLMIHRIPIRMYYLPQQSKYIMIFYGNYPLSRRRLVCKGGEVVKLPVTGISPWKDCTYEIKDKQKVILLDDYFRRPGDLHVLLGLQKDPDADDIDDKEI